MGPLFADLGDGLELNLAAITDLHWRRNPDGTLCGCEVGLVGALHPLTLTAKQATALHWALADYRATEPEEADEVDPVAILGARAAVVQ